MGTNRKRIKHYLLFYITFQIIISLLFSGCGKIEATTLDDISFDNNKQESIVYIKEDGIYTPYIVVTSDFNGNALLLRKDLLPNTIQYKENDSVGWSAVDEASVYEKSDIDTFLNTEFLDCFSDTMKKNIINSEIEVTNDIIHPDNEPLVHTISRKVFILSAYELNLGLDSITINEGKTLKYFEGGYDKKLALMADGTSASIWTRTPDISSTCLVIVVGEDMIGCAPPDSDIGVRPAFCISKSTLLKKTSNIIEGETVYVLE